MAGGAKAKAKASLIWPSAAMARPATALTCSSGDSRSLQSFRFTNAMPLFWPVPLKLKPWMEKIAFTASRSFSRKCRSSRSIDCIVRSCVAPTGAITWLNSVPWSSSGRNALGSRTNSRPITTTSAANTAMKRPPRARMCRTTPR